MSTQPGETKRPFRQEIAEKCLQLNIPFEATLELTYRCNLRCAHCYVDLVENDELSFEEWKGVLDQLKAAGTMFLMLTGGEIMVRSDFLDIVNYARRSGFFIDFLSNCTLITPDIVRAIAEMKTRALGTSLYGATAATHDSVTGVPGSFERTLEGIRLLVSAGVATTVQTVAMKANVNELAQIEELVQSLGARPKIGTGMAHSKTGSDFPLQLEPGEEDLMNCGWQQHTTGSTEDYDFLLCKAGKGVCSVSPRGDIFPCIMFPLKLGNLREKSFDAIWRLEPRAELRYLRSMGRSDLYVCRSCELSSYCERCTGSAYLESGQKEIDGPSPSACRQARKRWRLTQPKEVITK